LANLLKIDMIKINTKKFLLICLIAPLLSSCSEGGLMWHVTADKEQKAKYFSKGMQKLNMQNVANEKFNETPLTKSCQEGWDGKFSCTSY
jgi:hypothetical protein